MVAALADKPTKQNTHLRCLSRFFSGGLNYDEVSSHNKSSVRDGDAQAFFPIVKVWLVGIATVLTFQNKSTVSSTVPIRSPTRGHAMPRERLTTFKEAIASKIALNRLFKHSHRRLYLLYTEPLRASGILFFHTLYGDIKWCYKVALKFDISSGFIFQVSEGQEVPQVLKRS